jgi:hypothetical protein
VGDVTSREHVPSSAQAAVAPRRNPGLEETKHEPSRLDFVEKNDIVTIPEGAEDILPRILAILEKQIEDSGTLQKFVLGLSERVDSLEAASAARDTELSELRAEIAALKKRLKKAKKK